MAKEIMAKIKLQVPAGKANPAPPVGPALGQHGVNIMEFCKAFNAKTQKMGETIIPVIITVYSDRSFTFITKTPPAAELLKKAAGIIKGSGVPNKDKVGKVTRTQIKEIAQTKLPDLNAASIESAMRMIEGSAKSMGLEVVEELANGDGGPAPAFCNLEFTEKKRKVDNGRYHREEDACQARSIKQLLHWWIGKKNTAWMRPLVLPRKQPGLSSMKPSILP